MRSSCEKPLWHPGTGELSIWMKIWLAGVLGFNPLSARAADRMKEIVNETTHFDVVSLFLALAEVSKDMLSSSGSSNRISSSRLALTARHGAVAQHVGLR